MTFSRTKKLVAASASVAVVAGGGVAMLAGPASATEKRGTCGSGTARYDFDVEKDDGGFDTGFEIDSNVQGQKWRMTLRHDGKRVFRDVRTTDNEGEADFERFRPNTAGKDVFKVTAKRVGGGAKCTIKIVRS